MFSIPKFPDVTQLIRKRLKPLEVLDESEYPRDPSEGLVIYDRTLEVLKTWNGKRWIVAVSRVGIKP